MSSKSSKRSKGYESEPLSASSGMRRRHSADSNKRKHKSTSRLLNQDQQEQKSNDDESTPEQTPSPSPSPPPQLQTASYFQRCKRLFGLGCCCSSSSTNITPENIYATANVGAFAALLSLLSLVIGIITIMLTHDHSLIETMQTSYQFMKEMSEGYHLGIAEIKEKNAGRADMEEQISQFVQTMYALPWRELRESIDQPQMEELFKTLANVPQTIDQVQDMAWTICVALRRIIGLPSDYCIPSNRYPPSKIIMHFVDPPDGSDLFDASLSDSSDGEDDWEVFEMDVKGEYLEKALPETVQSWHKQLKEQTVNLMALNGDDDVVRPADVAMENFQKISSMIAIEPRVFEKLLIHQSNQDDIWSLLYGVEIMLINRFLLHNDWDWHLDYIKIENVKMFPCGTMINYNPTYVSLHVDDGIQILVKELKVRDPKWDTYSEYHTFRVKNIKVNDLNADLDKIEYEFYKAAETSPAYKVDEAKRKIILMDMDAKEWSVRIKSKKKSSDKSECYFKASMDKQLHKGTSWQFCTKERKGEIPPIIFYHQIEVIIPGNVEASGIYVFNDSPFEMGYFAQFNPILSYIFVMRKSKYIYRLFMAKSPDLQWYIQRFESESKAINICKLPMDIQGDERHSASNEIHSTCSRVVPYSYWGPSDINPMIRHLRALSIEFHYDKEVYSIYLIYKRLIGKDAQGKKTYLREVSISLQKEILIKGSDIYFKMFTKKDEHDLDLHYNQIVLDMTTYDLDGLSEHDMCEPVEGEEYQLPTVQMDNYEGRVEGLGGEIEGKFIIVFYSEDDCRNLRNTLGEYTKPVSFLP